MVTSKVSAPSEAPVRARGSVRLRLARSGAPGRLDGGWWPRSHDVALETIALADHFPSRFGRIVRVELSSHDWESAHHDLAAAGSRVAVDVLPAAERHIARLTMSDRTVLSLLVVPPGFSPDQGEEALLAAATSGNAHSAADLLEEVTDGPDIDPEDRWIDGDESWSRPGAVPSPLPTPTHAITRGT
ncbi:DUF5994 family protein [Nocardioides sp. BP30]|uniref:DUF5994 family protein n=1 Tax=Nocardioides sp. BP30 TaxID=3036374 RepID=UPI00246985AF|nr:DUF5994 family protein [Nocardioides sp. BP30]WGL50809.1 DUF5994 family protein [Nocardioides sp. BP30]